MLELPSDVTPLNVVPSWSISDTGNVAGNKQKNQWRTCRVSIRLLTVFFCVASLWFHVVLFLRHWTQIQAIVEHGLSDFVHFQRHSRLLRWIRFCRRCCDSDLHFIRRYDFRRTRLKWQIHVDTKFFDILWWCWKWEMQWNKIRFHLMGKSECTIESNEHKLFIFLMRKLTCNDVFKMAWFVVTSSLFGCVLNEWPDRILGYDVQCGMYMWMTIIIIQRQSLISIKCKWKCKWSPEAFTEPRLKNLSQMLTLRLQVQQSIFTNRNHACFDIHYFHSTLHCVKKSSSAFSWFGFVKQARRCASSETVELCVNLTSIMVVFVSYENKIQWHRTTTEQIANKNETQ